MKLWPSTALAIAVAACTVEYAPPTERQGRTAPDVDTTLVLAELRAYYRDFSARDWHAFADHFWPGATITTEWQAPGADSATVATWTVPDFVAAAPEGPGSRSVFEEVPVHARIRRSDHLAQAWVRYHARFGDPGDIVEWDGIDAFTLIEFSGRWRITSLAFAPMGGGP